jgi:hypothetical protein
LLLRRRRLQLCHLHHLLLLTHGELLLLVDLLIPQVLFRGVQYWLRMRQQSRRRSVALRRAWQEHHLSLPHCSGHGRRQMSTEEIRRMSHI